MTHVPPGETRELSLFAFGAMLLHHRWRIARWMFVGAAIAVVLVVRRPKLYTTTASFVPQTADASRSNLASLAGQFGLAIPTGSATGSPEFYVRLLRSRELLASVVRDSFIVAEEGGRRSSFLDLFEVTGASPSLRQERGQRMLSRAVSATSLKGSGMVELAVTTPWPSVSRGIAERLLAGLVAFNRRTRQDQAGSERKFIEERLAQTRLDLRSAEDRLARFLETNRQLSFSPELTFQRDRFQREVSFQQALVTSLAQSLEDARIREDRDAPVIVVVDPPFTPTIRDPRGAVKLLMAGLVLGAMGAIGLVALIETMRRKRTVGDRDAEILVDVIGEMFAGVRAAVGRLRPGVKKT